MRIPSSPDAITAEWLSQALGARYPGARAASVDVVDAHSGTTGRARLRVRWEEPAGAPAALFAKLPPDDPVQREMVRSTGMGRREARFYAELAGEVPVRVAAPVWAGWSDDGAEYLVLVEDLVSSGCSYPRPSDPCILDYTRSLIDSLARLHAHYWESGRFAGDLGWVEAPMRSPVGPALVRSALEQFGPEMPPVFDAAARLYLEHTVALCDLLDAGEATLIHGDPHLGNLFAEAGRIGFLDWACLARAPGMRDVSYFLCSSIAIGLRRAEERRLLERYRAGLVRGGLRPPSGEALWRQHRRQAVCAWISAAATAAAGSRMQSLAIGRRALERTNAALADLGTPELLCEELGLA